MRFGENINYLWKMKELILITLLFCCAFNTKAQNLILNGSFEQNSANSCYMDYNDSNPYGITNYGSYFYLFKDSCLVCSPPVYWGGGAQDQHYFLEVANDYSTITFSRFSFILSIPLSNNKNYNLSFYIRKPPPPLEGCGNDVGNNKIKVGISNNATNFGTHLITSPLGDSIWTQYSIVFNTQNAETFVIVEAGEDSSNLGLHIDNFVLVETTVSAINELSSNNKQLLKIVDILGRESKSKKGLLFYIYSDGTVEKKLIIE